MNQRSHSCDYPSTLNPSNTKQWADLLIAFHQQNSHFQEFRMKLPHSNGQFVKGIGCIERVKDFYQNLNSLELFGQTDVDSIDWDKSAIEIQHEIPEELITAFVPPDDPSTLYLRIGRELKVFDLNDQSDETESFCRREFYFQRKLLITNNGKAVAIWLQGLSVSGTPLVDVLLNEKMIENGNPVSIGCDLKQIFERYGLESSMEVSSVLFNLYRLWQEQKGRIVELGLEKVFELERQVIWVTAKIESAGFQVDVDRLLQYYEELQKEMKNLEDEIYSIVPAHVPLNGGEKFKAYVNRTFRTNLVSINQKSAPKIRDLRLREILERYARYQSCCKEIRDMNSYIERIGSDDRLRDEIVQINTKTGRFERDLQRVKKAGPMRSFFTAREGYSLICADYSQQEARVMAALSGDQEAVEIFRRGGDIYLEVAKQITGKTEAECRRYRGAAKVIFLGLNNGLSDYSAADELRAVGIHADYDDVIIYIGPVRKRFSGIVRWQDEIAEKAQTDGFVTTVMGRRLNVFDGLDSNKINSFLVQGSAADGFKMALVDLDQQLDEFRQDQRLDEYGLEIPRIVHILHDEVIVEAPDLVADEVADQVKASMERAFNRMLPNVPFKVEPKIRKFWKEYKN